MKATTLHGTGDVRVESVPDPRIVDPTDAVLRRVPGLEPGIVMATSSWGWWRRLAPRCARSARGFQAARRLA